MHVFSVAGEEFLLVFSAAYPSISNLLRLWEDG
jgi:hypothetical protein